jgi:hypothetical protein
MDWEHVRCKTNEDSSVEIAEMCRQGSKMLVVFDFHTKY